MNNEAFPCFIRCKINIMKLSHSQDRKSRDTKNTQKARGNVNKMNT